MDQPTDEEILKFEKEVKASELALPLVSEKMEYNVLEQEYASGLPIYLEKIHQLGQKSSGFRKIRKDGNCFYRAFGFRLCELLLSSQNQEFITKAINSKQVLECTGYDMSLLEDFFEPFYNVFSGKADLVETFTTEYMSDTIVCYLRVVTAALLKRDRDLYEAFVLDSYPSLEAFIGNCVEPMNVESDQIHIVAMANVFGVHIKIANLDATSGPLNYHVVSPMESIPDALTIELLYRPGHYDICYP